MTFKILAWAVILLTTAFKCAMIALDIKSAKNPIPENVSDVYDNEAYRKWIAYNKDKNTLELVETFVTAIALALHIRSDMFARVVNWFNADNVYVTCLLVVAADLIIGLFVGIAFSAYDTFVIEEKYGFNKMTVKTFIIDNVKSTIISIIVEAGLISLFILIHKALGALILPVFTAVIMAVIILVMFLSPYLMKIFNKATPIEDGSLKEKLTKLLEDNGCTVREIGVIDASKRSTKANAYFTGFGKTKSIGLYDTLINQMTEDEIVSVFAHEMGHNKHKDTIKMGVFSVINVVVMVVLAFLLVNNPGIYAEFGFTGMNYGFAFILLGDVLLPFISPLLSLLSMWFSRKNEYAADRFAAEQGYGKELISSLKKLSKANFANLNPHPIVVKLTYSHPTTSQRINALDDYFAKEGKKD